MDRHYKITYTDGTTEYIQAEDDYEAVKYTNLDKTKLVLTIECLTDNTVVW